MIDIDELIKIAKKKGLKNKEFIEKDYYIDLLLYEFSSLTNNLVFKGGTALYKIYGFPRFSEDIDFTAIGKIDINKIIDKISKKHKFKISKKTFGTSIMLKFSFDGFLTEKNRIRIDINRYHKTKNYSLIPFISSYIDFPPFMLYVMNKNEILAEKIHAIYNRNKARDLYDLFYLLRTEKPDIKLIKTKVPEFKVFDFLNKLPKYEKTWDREIKLFAMEYVSYPIVKEFVIKAFN